MRISEPIAIGSMELKNRLMMAAMDLGFVKKGVVSERLISFHVERAKGGVAFIIVGGCHTEKRGRMWSGMIGLSRDEYIPGLRKLTDAIHAKGARAGAQLLHGGGICHSAFIKEQPVSASAVRCMNKRVAQIPRELSPEEIKETIANFARAACRAREAGFDAVELNASMGYLINQFLSPLTNKRWDRYGGALTGRMTFLIELIAALKSETGSDFPVIVKISGDELMPGGNKLRENTEIARAIQKAGGDAVSVGPGRHDASVSCMSLYIPKGAYLSLAQEIKACIDIPVIAGNRLASVEFILDPLENDQADLVCLGRPLIADPELPNKIMAGREREIRWCLSCNQGCFDNIVSFKPVECAINARAGREVLLVIEKAENPKKILVVGGGPAGMEAARVCRIRGHDVHLYEKGRRLGGQAAYAARVWRKEEIKNIIQFLENELSRMNVEVFMNREADPALIKNETPDAVIIATGARPVRPPILGADNPRVLTAERVLSGREKIGRQVVIIGGGSIGCEMAIHLAKMGKISNQNAIFLMQAGISEPYHVIRKAVRGNKTITILEQTKGVGGKIGRSTRWVVLNLLDACGVDIIDQIQVEEIHLPPGAAYPGRVTISRDGKRENIPADTVIIAAGYQAENSLHEKIKAVNGIELYIIGDAREPRYIRDAIHEGFEIACKI